MAGAQPRGAIGRSKPAPLSRWSSLALTPDDASLWYNRGLASRFIVRFGQALRDFERAVVLESDPVLAQKVAEELHVSRQMVERELAMRGPTSRWSS